MNILTAMNAFVYAFINATRKSDENRFVISAERSQRSLEATMVGSKSVDTEDAEDVTAAKGLALALDLALPGEKKPGAHASISRQDLAVYWQLTDALA